MDKSMNIKAIAVVILVAVLAAIGVIVATNSDDDDTASNSDQTTAQTAAVNNLPFDLQLTNLAPLAQGEYEGWVVQGDDKISFGRFNTTEAGAIDGDLSLDGGTSVSNGDTIAISIEPENDTDPGPSETIVLVGEVTNNSAELAFPLDISEFSGQYILATPTTTTTDDETAGLWFTTDGTDTALNIPVAPAGWAYEGWAVVDGQPISSGLFTDPSMADFFDGFSGPGNAPNKPGEDFITNLPNGLEGPLDLLGSTIVVSIEPYQNGEDPTGPMPAQVKPLTHAVAADATDHNPYDLVLGTDSLPFGTVSL